MIIISFLFKSKFNFEPLCLKVRKQWRVEGGSICNKIYVISEVRALCFTRGPTLRAIIIMGVVALLLVLNLNMQVCHKNPGNLFWVSLCILTLLATMSGVGLNEQLAFL